jgi:putative tricarboxylic transport membrane protein
MLSFVRRGDFWAGLALAALGTYIVSEARGWVYMGEDGPGAGFFPMWYGSAMIVLSLALVAATVLKSAPETTRSISPWQDLGRALACWAAFVASVALMPVFGFPIAFAFLTWFIVAVMARQPQRTAWAVAIGGSALFYAIFEFGLDLSLPRGMLY